MSNSIFDLGDPDGWPSPRPPTRVEVLAFLCGAAVALAVLARWP